MIPKTKKEAIELGAQFFKTGKRCKHGHISERYTNDGHCRKCMHLKDISEAHKNRRKIWWAANKKRIVRNRADHPAKYLWESAKRRALKRGIPFTITISDVELVIPKSGLCPILGIEIRVSKSIATDNSMSLDRIRPELGYVPGNIAVMSNLANRIKTNQTDCAVFRKVADWLEKTVKL